MLVQLDLVLFNCCVIEENGITFLDLDERNDFMKRGLDDGISLVVIFHKLFKTTERHTKHFSESHWVNSILLGVEHARFSCFNIFKLIDFRVITTNSLVLDLPLGLLIYDVSLRELLPRVLDLVIDQSISLLEDLTDFIVSFELN